MVEALPEPQEDKKPNGELDAAPETAKVVDGPTINGSTTNGEVTHTEKRPRTHSDPDAQQMVIASLRSQVQDLFSQVNELNNKLVKSYDRVSDLEDDLHMASANNRASTIKISQLELERTQHLSALNTGLLVEKTHVTAELNRLMEKATEEAAQRGQAESARRDIEKDLDDLSATLFGQANTMVAEARFAQHLSEQKVGVAESALKSAEEAVSVMQQQMQALQAEKEEAEKRAEDSVVAMGMSIGQGMGKRLGENTTVSVRLLSSHSPFQEFLLFVAHLRSIHPSSPQPPAMTTLLPLPFLARLLTEDSEPTIRLDLAPSLNWLSRRSVLAAIHNGQLIIEPMSSTTLLQEPSISGSNNSNVSCALCGTSIFSTTGAANNSSLPTPPILGHSNSGSSSWSAASLFKKPSISAITTVLPTPPSRQSFLQQPSPSQVYIFRLAVPSSNTSSISMPSLPRTSLSGSSSASPQQTNTDNHASYTTTTPNTQSSTIYPLCTNNWCLSRLRMTCSLWAFVRSGIIEKIWEEEVPTLPTTTASPASEKPPIPPRRRGIWGMASALGERATSWGEGDKDKNKKSAASTPTPPPIEPKHPERRRLPPPLPAASANTTTVPPTPPKHNVPPPLPKRSEVRRSTTPKAEAPTTTESASSTNNVSTSPAKDPKLPPRPPRRPITPASVPLPESRPHTPPIANGGAVAAPGGAAVPPPLPRRAAARPSRLVDDSASPTAPSAPAAEAKPEESDQPSKVVESEQSATSAPAAQSASEAPVPAPVAAEETDATKEKNELEATASDVVSPSDDKEEFVDAPSEPGEVVHKEDAEGTDNKAESSEGGKKGEEEEKKEEEKVNEEEKEEEEKAGEEVKNKEKQEEKAGEEGTKETVTEEKLEPLEKMIQETLEDKSENVEVKPEAKAAPEEVEAQGEKEKEAQKTKPETANSDDDGSKSLDDDVSGAYVGDATWEERTWKEIVRLKEDMFWARIGGTRN